MEEEEEEGVLSNDCTRKNVRGELGVRRGDSEEMKGKEGGGRGCSATVLTHFRGCHISLTHTSIAEMLHSAGDRLCLCARESMW